MGAVAGEDEHKGDDDEEEVEEEDDADAGSDVDGDDTTVIVSDRARSLPTLTPEEISEVNMEKLSVRTRSGCARFTSSQPNRVDATRTCSLSPTLWFAVRLLGTE